MRCIIPEGPEVRIIGENLARLISNKILVSTEILSGRYLKKQPSGWGDFLKVLPVKVVGAGVHGKFLYWLCDKEIFIYSTLGMAGTWESKKTKHSRIKFKFSDNSEIFFNDSRNFGTIKLVRGKHNLIEKLKSLGPDMMSEDIPDKKFVEILRTKNSWNITKALMDQSVIAGVGNYIKSDSLFLAQLSPHRDVCDLSDGELAVLNRSIKQVMRESFELGGSYSGNSPKLIYGKKKDSDGNKIIKEETADGRSTYWNPEVQK